MIPPSIFSDAPGTYILRLTADDGEKVTSDEITVVVRAGDPIVSVSQTTYFDTGFFDLLTPLTIPAIDPSGFEDNLRGRRRWWQWRPTLPWFIFSLVMLMVTIHQFDKLSEFIYFQF